MSEIALLNKPEQKIFRGELPSLLLGFNISLIDGQGFIRIAPFT